MKHESYNKTYISLFIPKLHNVYFADAVPESKSLIIKESICDGCYHCALTGEKYTIKNKVLRLKIGTVEYFTRY